MNGAKLLHLARHLDFRRGRIAQHADIPAQNRLWDDEWYRCFGDSRFDYVVDFSGYGPFWATLLLHSPDAQRAIWLHNDLAVGRAPRGERREADAAQPHADLHPLRAVRPPGVGVADAGGDQPRVARRVRGARRSSCRR